MNTTTPSSTPGRAAVSDRRALVLAGGGAAGNAWEVGLIAGLADAGVDVTEADLIVGTSAGSTVAAQVTSAPPAEVCAAILAEVHQPPAGDAGSDRRRAPGLSGPSYLKWSNDIIAAAESASDMRRRMGAAALAMEVSSGPGPTRWRECSPMSARVTPSTPTRWTRQLVRRPRGEATSRADASRSASLRSGPDARGATRS